MPDVDGFLAGPFGRDRFRGRLPGGEEAGRRLFDWETLNRALAEHRLGPPRLRLEQAAADITRTAMRERRNRRGVLVQDLDPEALTARLRDGATLILDGANELSPPLQALCEGLGVEFLSACQANLYACWGEVQGFDVHWDDHDVFVVQIAGRKHWRLYGSTRFAPSRRDHHGEHLRPERAIEDFAMEPGDVLYLPRGYWHAAAGVGEPSLHLTVGLTRKAGTDFLHWLADHAVDQDHARADLPLEATDEALVGRIEALIAWVAAQHPADLARLYRRRVAAGQVHRPRLSFPYIGRKQERPGACERVRLASGAVSVGPGEFADEVVLEWRGMAFTVSSALEAPLRRLARGEPIALSALNPAGGPEQVAVFVDEMLARGVFVVEGRDR